jgi:hypothetical protein
LTTEKQTTTTKMEFILFVALVLLNQLVVISVEGAPLLSKIQFDQNLLQLPIQTLDLLKDSHIMQVSYLIQFLQEF